MNRRAFVRQSAVLSTVFTMPGLHQLYQFLKDRPASPRMPALFIGHGNPMNAIEDNVYSRSWQELGRSLPRPSAILCISAHWLTMGQTKVAVTPRPETIHDFGGFPKALFDQQYPAPGAPDIARQTIELVQQTHVQEDDEWGLDHGAWSVLIRMFPGAEIPVFQLSIDYRQPAQYHYELARELKSLREKGVLIIGSGNLVHNLRTLNFDNQPYDWALEFDRKMAAWLKDGDDAQAIAYHQLGKTAELAHPTVDHLLPLFYTLGVADKKDERHFFNEQIDLGSISMRSMTLA